MKKYPKSSSQLATKAHRFAVNSLVGLTAIGLGILSIQVYHFMTAVRPELEQQRIAQQNDQQNQ